VSCELHETKLTTGTKIFTRTDGRTKGSTRIAVTVTGRQDLDFRTLPQGRIQRSMYRNVVKDALPVSRQ
jgi:hypothetical protein